jgi:hypothetical protein
MATYGLGPNGRVWWQMSSDLGPSGPKALGQHEATLLGQHHDKPQNLMRVQHAFRAMGEALAELASMGHQFHLAEGPPGQGEIWPRLYFHAKAAPNGRLVHSPFELGDLGPDWYPTLDQAQHADGMATQFAGRGGIGRRDLPMVIEDSSPGPIDLDARRQRMIEDFKSRKGQ